LWDEGDDEGAPIEFFMEFDGDGAVLRQVELSGEQRRPIAAASAAEFWAAQGGHRQASTPQLDAYRARFGQTAEGTRSEWGDDYPGVEIERSEFEEIWHQARSVLARARL
jgi:hypothetical protein